MNRFLLFSGALVLASGVLHAQFTQGNIAVFLAASATANNTTASIVELSPSTSGQTTPVTYAINGTTGANALRFSGSATSTGYLTSTDDNSLLVFSGLNSTASGSNSNTITTRGIGTFNATGTFNLATTYTGVSGNQPRSATSVDNTNWYIADQGGIYTNGTSAASPAGNFRSAKSFGGTVYVSAASQIGTINATTGGSVTALPGLTVSNLQDFYMIQSGSNGTTYDVLYVLSATTATAGTISKYSLVSGSWVSNGTYTTTFGGFGLLAKGGSGFATLYTTTGLGATAANNVVRLNDGTGYNATININASDNTVLYTAPAGTTLKGIANAPTTTSPLALNLTSFAVKNNGNNNLITWTIAEGNNGDNAILERSNDGKTFSTLTTIAVTAAASKYQFTDANPFDGVTYYRLSLAGIDGNKTYSNVVSVSNTTIAANAITVFPNPVTGTELYISLKKATTVPLVITVADNFGKVIATQTIASNANTAHAITLPAGMANGVYYVTATNGANTYHQTITVSK